MSPLSGAKAAKPPTPSLDAQRRLDSAIDRVTNKARARVWRYAGLVRETKSALSNLYLILNIVIGIIVFAIAFVCGLLSNIYFTQRLPEVATLSAIGYSRRFLVWRAVKETLLKNVGMGGIPTIKIEDADYGHNRVLYLKHYHDGRDLQLEYAERTLAYLERLWGHETVLETTVNGANMILSYSDKGFTTRLC